MGWYEILITDFYFGLVVEIKLLFDVGKKLYSSKTSKIELLNSKPNKINLTIWLESQNVNILIPNSKTQETISKKLGKFNSGRGGNKPQQSNFKTEEANNITEPKCTSNAFNDCFVGISSKLASQIRYSIQGNIILIILLNQHKHAYKYNLLWQKKLLRLLVSSGHDDITNMVVKKSSYWNS